MEAWPWDFAEPFWLLSLVPAALLLYALFRLGRRPVPATWAFLLKPEDRLLDWRERSTRLLLWPFIFCILAFACLTLIPALPGRERELRVLLEHSGVIGEMRPEDRDAWRRDLTSYAEERGYKSLRLYFAGRSVRLGLGEVAGFLPEKTTGKSAAPPVFDLACGLDASAHPEKDFLPYPTAPDSWALTAVSIRGKGSCLVRVCRWDPLPRKPLAIMSGSKDLAPGKGFLDDETTVEVRLGAGPKKKEISLSPADAQPWTDRASWEEPEIRELETKIEAKLPAGVHRAFSEFWYAGEKKAPLLITSDPGRFVAHNGPAWLMCPATEVPGVYGLRKAPVDSPYRAISHRRLAMKSRHTLFDLQLGRLPAHHLVDFQGWTLLSHAGETVLADLGKGRLVQTLAFDAIRFSGESEERDLATLCLGALGFADLDNPPLCHKFNPPKNREPRISPPAASARLATPLILLPALLLASLAFFALAMAAMRRRG